VAKVPLYKVAKVAAVQSGEGRVAAVQSGKGSRCTKWRGNLLYSVVAAVKCVRGEGGCSYPTPYISYFITMLTVLYMRFPRSAFYKFFKNNLYFYRYILLILLMNQPALF
jgi:hypothetical protein